MSSPEAIENHMVVDGDLINERGIDFWIRGEHRKVDPDQGRELGLPYDDDKPAHEKILAE